jgi:hypothetical protein
VWEWNECPERGYGAWWLYIPWGSGVGWFGAYGVQRRALVGGEGRWRVGEGSRRWLARAGTRGEAATPYLIDGQNFDIAPLLLLPNTRRQREEGAAIVEFDQGWW